MIKLIRFQIRFQDSNIPKIQSVKIHRSHSHTEKLFVSLESPTPAEGKWKVPQAFMGDVDSSNKVIQCVTHNGETCATFHQQDISLLDYRTQTGINASGIFLITHARAISLNSETLILGI